MKEDILEQIATDYLNLSGYAGLGRTVYFTNYPERDGDGTYPNTTENDKHLMYNAIIWAAKRV